MKAVAAAVGLCTLLYFRVLPGRLVWGVGLFGAGLVVLLVVFQEKILYIPEIQGMKTPQDNPKGLRSPDELALAYEDVKLRTKDGLQLHGWFLPAPSAPEEACTIMFCHENAGNIGLRLEEFRRIHYFLKVNQLVFDYRGYGYSQGVPSEEGLVIDAETALSWLDERASRGRIDGKKLILSGRSLGGAVAVQLASRLPKLRLSHQPRALILENTFTSISAMVDHKFPVLNIPFFKEYFLRLKWDTLSTIPRIPLPMLFLSSSEDEIVPASHMTTLKAAATAAQHTEIHTFKATHNDIFVAGGERYWDVKREFISRFAS